MYQITFRWSADFLYMDKVTRGHQSMVSLTPRVVWESVIYMYTLSVGMGDVQKYKKKIDYWTSTSNKSVGTQPKYTWWHGLGLGFILDLSKGHGKVISRAHQGQIS